MCIKTEALKFLDITNYMAPGFSYSQYLKVYECTEGKGFIPYEWMTSLKKLNVSQLPSHKAFYSTLKNGNISAEDYQLCQKVWEDNNMTTMKEFLTWYYTKDVKPLLEAIDKMYLYYQNQNEDIIRLDLPMQTYYCFWKEDQFSCKGINKRTNQITKDKYMDVLLSKKSGSSTVRGFRSMDNQVSTYFQEMTGFSYFYPKRKVLADGVSTAPLKI
jgi:hypothetical protein